MKVLIASALLLTTSLAYSQTAVITDGNSLAAGLEAFKRGTGGASVTAKQADAAIAAVSYVNGFLGACAEWQLDDKNSPFQLPKTGVSIPQAVKIVEKFLTDHPEDLHSPADALCFIILAKAFPNPNRHTINSKSIVSPEPTSP
jgi:hypothetical protein